MFAAMGQTQPDAPQQMAAADNADRPLPSLTKAQGSPNKEQQQQAAGTTVLAGSSAGSKSQLPDVNAPVVSDHPQATHSSDHNAPLSRAKQQLQADLTDDLAASEAAVDTALAAATAASLTAEAPHIGERQNLRAQIPDNALLTSPQPAESTEDLAASETAVDSALTAAAASLSSSRGPNRTHAKQQLHRDLTDDLTAEQAAMAAARNSLSSPAADADRKSVQDGLGLAPRTATRPQLPAEAAASSEGAVTEDVLAVAAAQDLAEQDSAPEVAESSAFTTKQVPTDSSSLSAESSTPVFPPNYSPTVAPEQSLMAAPSPFQISSSADAAAAAAAVSISAAAVQEAGEEVAQVMHDSSLAESMAAAAAEGAAAAAVQEADKAASGAGAFPGRSLVSAPGPAPATGPTTGAVSNAGSGVAPPPAELSQELAADLKELQALRSQVNPSHHLTGVSHKNVAVHSFTL